MKDFIFIRNPNDNKIIKIYLSDIIFIEALGDYCKIVTKVKNYILHFSLGRILDFLDKEIFIRCNRSTIVNINLISQIEYEVAGKTGKKYVNPKIVIMDNKISIGDNYKNNLLSSINYVSNKYEIKESK